MSAPARTAGPAGRPGGRPGGGGPPWMGGGAPTSKAEHTAATAKRLFGLLDRDRPVLLVVMLMAILSVGFQVAGPRLLGKATDIIFEGVISQQLGRQMPAGTTQEQAVAALRAGGQDRIADMVAALPNLVLGQGIDMGALWNALFVVIGIYALATLFTWLQAYLMAGVTQRAVHRLREQVDLKLGRLPLKYFDTTPRGDLLSRVTNDIDNINTGLQQSLTQVITSVATVLGILGMMLWISPLLALIAVITVPLSFIVTILVARRSGPQFAEQWKWTGTLNGHVEEMFSGHDLVAVYGQREKSLQTFSEANEKVYSSSLKAQFISGVIMPATNVIGNLGYVAIAVVGAIRITSGQMSLGDVQAFIQYSRQFTMPITQLASQANMVQSALASAERVFDLLDAEEESPDPAPVPQLAGRAEGHVEFDDISFGYSPDKPLITGLTLEAMPGQTVAIVGPTGAGKTTLVNLLMRFYELDGGAIRLDGVNIADLPREQLRRNMGIVLQDTWLFAGSVADNILYGAPPGSVDRDRMLAAAEAAHVDHVVRTMPDGYDTELDDDASNLSSGEKQLLTIARAFLADPAILILDEATSSVDTRTEVLVQEAMNRLRAGRTSFVIAHRLSTIRGADVILVMEDGDVVERGTHEQLLAAGGAYARLYQSQFSEPIIEEEPATPVPGIPLPGPAAAGASERVSETSGE